MSELAYYILCAGIVIVALIFLWMEHPTAAERDAETARNRQK
jgi:hypothetical protein